MRPEKENPHVTSQIKHKKKIQNKERVLETASHKGQYTYMVRFMREILDYSAAAVEARRVWKNSKS